MSDKQLKEFKTQPCNKCRSSQLALQIDFGCQWYHNEHDKRRNPLSISYSGIYVQDNYNSSFCLNYVQYLYHTDNFRTERCTTTGCSSKYFLCPFYHNSKEAIQKKPNKNGLLANAEKELQELNKLLKKPSVVNGTNQSLEGINNVASKLQQNNLANFSAIGLMKSQSIDEIIQGFQSPSFYNYNQKVTFRQDRKHEFKSFLKINLKTLVPLIFEYMCAFQNCEGGTLFIGIDDDAFVRGVYMTNKDIDRLLLEIDQGCKSHFRPPLMPQKYRVSFVPVKGFKNSKQLDSMFVIEISILKEKGDDQLYLYNRQCYMRMNASTHRLLASQIIENERVKNQKKNEKEMVEYNSIMNGTERYFQRLPTNQLKGLKGKLEKALGVVSKVIQTGNHKSK